MIDFFAALFKPCPINSEMQPPFANMPINQIRAMVANEQHFTKEVVERCALGETYLGLKSTQYKAIGNYKRTEHKALVNMAKEQKNVKLSAKNAKREYRQLTGYRGGLFG